MWQLSPGAENLERRWQAMFTSQKPLLPAWQTGWGRGPAGGRSRFIDDDAAERPGEIKVKGSSPAEEEARPLFINQRGWDRAKRCRGCREEGDGRRLPARSAPTHPWLGPSGSQAGPCLLPLGQMLWSWGNPQHVQPGPHSQYLSPVKTVTGALRAGG